MSQERTEAVVLRGVDFSDTSRIVTFLCPDRGKMACMALGVRNPKSPMAASLDTFNRLEIIYYWKDGRNVQKLGEASLLNGYPGIKRDLAKSVYSAFPLELAYKAAQEDEAAYELYEAVTAGLDGMEAWTGCARSHAAWMALRILSAAGYEPSVECNGAPVGFAYSHGVTAAGEPCDLRFRPGEFEVLRVLAQGRGRCPALPGGDVGRVFGMLRGFAARQFEAEFRSLRVIDQIFG